MPSLNTGNAILSNAIAVDSSYNVSINGSIAIGAASASTFKAYIVGDVFGSTGFYTRNTADTFLGSSNNGSGIIVNGTTLVTKIVSGGNTVATFASTGAATFNTSASTAVSMISSSTASGLQLNNTGGTNSNWIIQSDGGAVAGQAALRFYSITASAYRMSIDGSGNVGIGTSSPTALDSGGVNLQIKDRSALFQLGVVNSTYLSNNVYYDGSWKRIVSGYGALIRLNDDSNGFSFLTTGTGGANSAVTFTTAMNITNTGNVGIGTPSPTALLHLGVANAAVDGTKGVKITNPAGTTVMLECGVSSDSFVGTTSASDFSIRTGNSPRMTITSGGVIQINGGNYYNGAGSVNTTVSSASEFCYSGANTNASNPRGVFISLPNSAAGDFAYYLASNAATKFYVNGNGAIYSTSTSITLISSDYNLKTDIKDYDKGLAEILAMKPRYFKYKDNLEEEKIGFIAQEMEQALAGSMIDVPTGLDTGKFHKSYQIDWYPLLVKAIQELTQKVENQQQTINSLINR